jgi:hypothetical protein
MIALDDALGSGERESGSPGVATGFHLRAPLLLQRVTAQILVQHAECTGPFPRPVEHAHVQQLQECQVQDFRRARRHPVVRAANVPALPLIQLRPLVVRYGGIMTQASTSAC